VTGIDLENDYLVKKNSLTFPMIKKNMEVTSVSWYFRSCKKEYGSNYVAQALRDIYNKTWGQPNFKNCTTRTWNICLCIIGNLRKRIHD